MENSDSLTYCPVDIQITEEERLGIEKEICQVPREKRNVNKIRNLESFLISEEMREEWKDILPFTYDVLEQKIFPYLNGIPRLLILIYSDEYYGGIIHIDGKDIINQNKIRTTPISLRYLVAGNPRDLKYIDENNDEITVGTRRCYIMNTLQPHVLRIGENKHRIMLCFGAPWVKNSKVWELLIESEKIIINPPIKREEWII